MSGRENQGNHIMDTPELLTTGQAAQRLAVSVSYLNKLRLNGGGPSFVKLGTRVAYDPSDLAAWVARQKRSSTSDDGAERQPAAAK